MQSFAAHVVKLLLAVAMSVGFAPATSVWDCGSPKTTRTCGCCKNPSAPSCCSAPENRSPVPQPAEPGSRASQQSQPAAPEQCVALRMPASVETVIFPSERVVPRGATAGHSFQSVRCIWTV